MQPPEQRSGERIKGRVVPIEFVFSPHRENDPRNVAFFEERAREALARYANGKVLIVTENATGRYQDSVMLQMAISRGYKPSVAAATIDNLSEEPLLPLANFRATPEETAAYLQIQSEYHQAQFGVMDRLTQEYPGRINWLVEGSSFEQSREIEKGVTESGESLEQACHLAEKGEFAAATSIFKKSVATAVNISSWRERHIINVIHQTIQVSSEIVGVVGQFGTAHTPIIHGLIRMGYPTTINFSDKATLPHSRNAKVFVFNPLDALERKLVIVPNTELSDQEYLRYLLGFLGYRILDLLSGDDSEYPDQANAFFSWELVDRLRTEEDTQKLQELIVREKNFIAGLEAFMGEEK